MALPRITSPHAKNSNRTQRVMLWVLAAALPGLFTLCYFYGIGPLLNLLFASVFALAFEATVLAIRQRPIRFFLSHGSALVTALLLALALPPYAPWWLVLVAVGFALLIGKHLFGGLGQNPFNPAMLGYVVVLVSFPIEMTTWPHSNSDWHSGLTYSLGLAPVIDGWSQATALDVLKTNQSLTIAELQQQSSAFGHWGGVASEWVNLAFLVGGILLLAKNIIRWQAPIAMLAALSLMSLVFWNGTGSASHGSPLFHLLTGATMLGAFFIVTDPVSGATSNLGRLIFGAGVGVLLYIIRAWGSYPDALAFAVLLMNMCAPTIDYFTKPRTYGHTQAKRSFNTSGEQ